MLRNRKEQEEAKLVGVNRVADPSKLKPGTFVSLANWIPAKRYKIKKKRGVEALVDSPPTPITPTTCGVCASEFPEAQSLPTVCCYDNITVWSGASETAGSINYVDPTDLSFWCTSCEGNGFSSGPYPDDASILWKLWEKAADCELTDISSTGAVAFTGHTANIQASQAAQAGRSGHSDEKSYVLALSSISASMFNGDTSANVYFGETSGAVPCMNNFACSNLHAWTKYGSEIFQVTDCQTGGFFLQKWPIPFADNYSDVLVHIMDAGPVSAAASPVPGLTSVDSFRDMHANANFLYILARGSEFAHPKICQVDKSDLTFIQSWDITNTDFASLAQSIFVFSDTLIFILGWDAATHAGTIGFLNTGTGVTTTIGSVSGCTTTSSFHASNTTGFQYANNYFFIGDDGGNVLQVGPLLCPGGSGSLWETV